MDGTTHAEQIARDRARGLTRAGIGGAYHRRRLAELGKMGDALTAWVNNEGPDEVRDRGMGWTLYGPGAASYDATVLLARGLFMKNVTVRVVSLRKMLRNLERGGEELAQMEDIDALFVTDFVQAYAGGILPLTGWDIVTVETFLGERLDQNRSVFLHSDRLLSGEGLWWSGNLLQRVARKNHLLNVRPE